jgi:hypothetical protein
VSDDHGGDDVARMRCVRWQRFLAGSVGDRLPRAATPPGKSA